MILCAMLSSGCDNHIRIAAPPVELTECADEPRAPALPAYDWSSIETAQAVTRLRDTAMLGYVLAFRTAFADCKADVAGVKAWAREAR